MNGVNDAQLASNLDAWLETMRGPQGYGGPVVHWWQNCLSYTGVGLDWRYEGIISGYLTLWRRTEQPVWLAKAWRAGDDLVHGQLPSGNFQHSSFEQNPYAGGTPHEAAADLGLLRLAAALRQDGYDDWGLYAHAAETNLRCYFVDRLWDASLQGFRNDPYGSALVPNKTCTLVEALFAWTGLCGSAELIEQYALPALHVVVALQVKSPGWLTGAIPQGVVRGNILEDHFPYYVARCIPALLQAYEFNGEASWLDAATAAGGFILRHVDSDGLLPQVLYTRGTNRYPQWIAPLGDVLRALELLRPYGFAADTGAMESALRRGALPSGGVATARGFGAQVNQRHNPATLPDFRDNVPVAGWADKAFAWLAGRVPEGQPLPPPCAGDVVQSCAVRGQTAQWRETAKAMTLTADGRTLYEWRKGESWARTVAPEVMA